MEEKKFVHENTGIPISNELIDDEKKYIKSMYSFVESVQIPMLTEKIIILSKKIEKFDKSSSSMSKRLLALTFFLVIIAILQIFLFICQIAHN